MASVYVQMRENKVPQMVGADIDVAVAKRLAEHYIEGWKATKKGRKAEPAPANGEEWLLKFSDGKIAGSVFIERLEPPVGPEAGSFKVKG